MLTHCCAGLNARRVKRRFGVVKVQEGVMIVRPRDRFSTEVTLDPSLVIEFARAAGDPNPVHHDPAFAATTRFGRPIASGTHTTALLLGLTASHFSRDASMVGLEFWVQFRPVYSPMRPFVSSGW
jgi:acyl dehydratase